MRVLIEALGSHGDVIPFIAVALELKRRGHDPHLFGNERFKQLATSKDIPFTATSTEQGARAVLEDARATDSRQGLRLVAAGMMGNVEHALGVLRDHMTPDSVVLGSTFAFAARLLAESQGKPFVAMHLAPSLYRSEHLAPRMSPLGHFESWPRWCKRAAWKVMDRRFLDPVFGAPLNRVRVRMGLPPVERLMHSWIHQGAMNIGAFPAWFAPRQPDWPNELHLAGFPLMDSERHLTLSPAVAAFLSRGSAPIIFTAGTANTSSHRFYAESAAACVQLGRRGVLVAQRRDQLPEILPEDVIHVPYAPFEALFSHAAAVVHHGGIGTLSRALAAGVPQLIQPMAYDQFDNASRACRLGVAKELLPRRYRAATVARALRQLMEDPRTKTACRARRDDMAQGNGTASICERIERVISRRA